MATTEVTDGSHSEVQSGASTSGAPSTNQDDNNTDSTYHLKWIHWGNGKIPIVMQSKNGPCPLIATMNVLLLREKIKLPDMLEQITANQLLTYLGECIMDSVPADIQNDENAVLNLEQNIHDAIEILPKLKTGLDVNIRFTGIVDFEYTPECIIFDLLRIPLYHGWLSDPELVELQNAIGNQSYNQLVDNIITNKSSNDPDVSTRVMIAEEFLQRTASQLTLHGLHELRSKIKDNEIGILFRNNHFLTLLKRDGEIYTLVTDHGYLTEDSIIWETLENIEGAGRFLDSNFQPPELSDGAKRQSTDCPTNPTELQKMNDYLVALSLKEEEQQAQQMDIQTIEKTDFELAKMLQDEEDAYYESQRRSGTRRWEEGELNRRITDLNCKQVVPIELFNPKGQNLPQVSQDPNKNQSQAQQLDGEAPTMEAPPSEVSQQPASQADTSRCRPSTSREELLRQSSGQPRRSNSLSNRRVKGEKNQKDSNCNVS